MRWLTLLAVVSCASMLEAQTGPVSADYPCGTNRHQCSDGMCCFNGWECTVDRVPIEADPPGKGYCEDALGKRREARRP